MQNLYGILTVLNPHTTKFENFALPWNFRDYSTFMFLSGQKPKTLGEHILYYAKWWWIACICRICAWGELNSNSKKVFFISNYRRMCGGEFKCFQEHVAQWNERTIVTLWDRILGVHLHFTIKKWMLNTFVATSNLKLGNFKSFFGSYFGIFTVATVSNFSFQKNSAKASDLMENFHTKKFWRKS